MTTKGLLWSAVACAALIVGAGSTSAEKPKDKDDGPVVTAEALTKEYATEPDAFDKKYKGKVVTVEGTVTIAATKLTSFDKVRYCVLGGYTKPGERFGYQVNCVRGAGFEGVRIGHKVRVRGTCQEHSKTRSAVVLQDCTVVKVLSDDFPPSKEVATEVKALQGKWKVTGVEGAGKATATQLGLEEIEVDEYEMSWRVYTGQKEGVISREVSFGLAADPEKKPKEMTLHMAAGSLPCIYELDKDRLRICVPLLGKSLKDAKRPTELVGGKDGLVVITAERSK